MLHLNVNSVRFNQCKEKLGIEKRLFLNFLAHRGLLRQYLSYIEKTDRYFRKAYGEEYINNLAQLTVEYLIISGFSWDGTEEGYKFWEGVNKDWIETLNILKYGKH